ncbi:hypothetical protein DOLIC_00117 [Dolichomitus sp. PSUC_FEM 10030005]|nr:hypothetical protein [Dolichomitus sp. PSUC_FEM 10030005]
MINMRACVCVDKKQYGAICIKLSSRATLDSYTVGECKVLQPSVFFAKTINRVRIPQLAYYKSAVTTATSHDSLISTSIMTLLTQLKNNSYQTIFSEYLIDTYGEKFFMYNFLVSSLCGLLLIIALIVTFTIN